MNKDQFLTIIREQLRPLSEVEREELLQDYEAHFEAGKQSGKTEKEISQDLGDPFELARDIVGERFEYVNVTPGSGHTNRTTRKTLRSIPLIFLSFIAVPFGIAVWGIWLSLSVTAALLTLLPIITLADVLIHGNIALVKVFLSMIGAGVGIFLGVGMEKTWNVLKQRTIRYVNWNFKRIGD